ncbi:MAG: ABC transporter ATP-binding protein [Candidatus Methanomethyliaceae archaeon]|nr:ABC transporter ATP-binding protein [Candidatus Methanomethyliaceae archaeon]
MLAIETRSLTKRFGASTAVDHLSFEVEEGEVFGLLGPNGAGKTTTIRMLACIVSPSGGSAKVAGYDIVKESLNVRKSVGILTENPNSYERLSAVENLEFFARAYGITDRSRVSERIKELLDFFQLWDRRNEKVATFSKGMKQKLAIARAIVHDPTILLLDEPTAGLDPEASKLIREMIERIGSLESHTVLLCTHRLEDAERLCNRVMIISKGSSKVVGTPKELRNRMGGHPKLEVTLKEVNREMVDKVRDLVLVEGVEVDARSARLLVTANDIQAVAPYVVKTLVGTGAMVMRVNVFLPSLEEAYLELIKEG